jgi:hypothetical protein
MHLVNHVHKNRAGAKLTPPGCVGVVVIRLQKSGAAHHGHQFAKFAGPHHVPGLGHDGTVGTVVADQHFGARSVSGLKQLFAFGHSGGHRLFQQDWQPGRDALQALRQMKMIRRGQNQSVRPVPGQKFVERCIERHAGPGRHVDRRRRRIHDRRQHAGQAVFGHIDVRLTNGASACNGNAGLVH